ncbi:hypothetical protein ADK67_27720 [Saccharothrix sp. NRRL B-16348]|uniref:hypothetical protein n=1 Tax=Saccharothrix sp. NRRL B-16348 TaxID=1415542 RepID=UPI0006AF3BAF|nr:hypothetical protein [Saccharothrix sp. NRRL B-16348]KOX21240.1 hypothetical protein ADK67_27720 [Saccharothrix sp. NRRL B-16348]
MAGIGDPSTLASVLLHIASVVLALTRLRDVIGPGRRGRALYVLDLVAALAVLFTAGWFADLVAELAHDRVVLVVAVGLAAGLAGMATTGFVALIAATTGGGGTPVIAWFVTPLLVGAALRNIRMPPEPPPDVGGDLTGVTGRWYMRPTALDVFWGFAARVVCVVPLVCVFLVPAGDVEQRARIGGAVVMWVVLLVGDRARRPLLIRHRRAARTTDVGLFLVLLAVAAGPNGEVISRWWAAHATEAQWYVVVAGPGVMLLYSAITPRFDRWRLSWAVVRARSVLLGLPQIALALTTLPFLVAGVFHPAWGPLESAFVALLTGLVQAAGSGWNGDGFHRQAADVLMLARAAPPERTLLLAGWLNDHLYRRRTLRVRTWAHTALPRLAGVAAHLGAEAAHATTAVHTTLPWGGSVRLDHTMAEKLLRVGEQALDAVDNAYPAQMRTPGTLGHLVQQTARADLAGRRSLVAQYLDDFEGAIAASRQTADHYTAVRAPAHAATELVHTANRLSAVGQHEAAAALLADVPDDLPPPVRRLLLVVRAAVAQRAGRSIAARSLLAAARTIPEHSTFAFRKAFLAERIKFPSFGEGAHRTLVATERELDRELGPTTPLHNP